jgi:hypothetical protein
MLQLLLQQLLQRIPQKQIWTYASAVVTQYPWTLFVLPAAKKTIHRQCLMAYLGTNSQCCYCCCPVDMKKGMDYEKIERSLPKPLTPVKTPKRDLQQMLMEEKTPLQEAD